LTTYFPSKPCWSLSLRALRGSFRLNGRFVYLPTCDVFDLLSLKNSQVNLNQEKYNGD
jgi:hypothetical protein